MARKKHSSAAKVGQAAPAEQKAATEVLDLDYGSIDASPAPSAPLSRKASKSPEHQTKAGSSTNLLSATSSIDVQPRMYSRKAPPAYEEEDCIPPQRDTASSSSNPRPSAESLALLQPQYHQPQYPYQQDSAQPEWHQAVYHEPLQYLPHNYMPYYAPSNEYGSQWADPHYPPPPVPSYDPAFPPMLPFHLQHPPAILHPPSYPQHEQQYMDYTPNGAWQPPQQHDFTQHQAIAHGPAPHKVRQASSREHVRTMHHFDQIPPSQSHAHSRQELAQDPLPSSSTHPPPPTTLPPPLPLSPDLANLTKGQRKRRAKQMRKQQQALLATKADLSVTDDKHQAPKAAMTHTPMETSHATNLTWSPDEKARAVAIIDALAGFGVQPLRLLQHGVSRSVVLACCDELGITASDPESAERRAETITMTAAEEQIVAKDEEGAKLTPLEELRKKALKSRLAKAAAAAAKSQAESGVSEAVEWPSLNSAFEQQLQRAARMLHDVLRPTLDTESDETRKRAYNDVDAADGNDDASELGSYFMGIDNVTNSQPPAQRQRVSYADSFSVRPQAPKGDVDLNAPVPTLTAAHALSTMPATKHSRPVAADFDDSYTVEPRAKRFLDVPHGLNTVVDISDDESEDDAEASGNVSHFELKSGLSEQQARQLHKKTGDELNAIYRSLHGKESMPRAIVKRPDETDVTTPHATQDGSRASAGDSREDLIRKELEIQLLTRKIQLRESQRRTRQGTPIEGPDVNSANNVSTDDNASVESQISQVPVPEKPDTDSKAGSTGLQLDPGLQKQRQALLELLALNRRNKPENVPHPTDNEALLQDAALKPKVTVSDSAADVPSLPDADRPLPAATQTSDTPAPRPSDAVRFEASKQGVLTINAAEHGYKPRFPALFQTVR